MLANAETKWAVFKAADALLSAIADGRHADTLACFTDDPDVALFGADAGEVVKGPDALRAFFADLYARPYRLLFTLDDRLVSSAGPVAWLTGAGAYSLSTGEGEPVPFRLTGVLERRRDQWLWQLFSASEPGEGRG